MNSAFSNVKSLPPGRCFAACIAALMLGMSQTRIIFADVLSDASNVENWTAYGRAYEGNHYSPLADINSSNVNRLALAWWFDIAGVVLASSVPLQIDGRIYFATGYSVVRALDAVSGRLLWVYDPEVANVAGRKLRAGWGIRGLAYWHNRIYVGTHDGRLISLDARSGKLLWSVAASERDDLSIITGPPLAFDGKVTIGYGGADLGPMRGYVTTYDAKSGKQLWRFFTVPGDPSRGFESSAMRMAADTWSGNWWKHGGGGTVWNAMTYDSELNRIYIGTSNGMPLDHKLRSPEGGDNLFLASIVALDADTGQYVWHYQTNPGETWDFDAAADIEIATVEVDNTLRRVLMQASKNGFFYLIDRDTGKLISAEKFAAATWAEKIDLKTGRPVEVADARSEIGKATIMPGPFGAHGPQAMAFSPMHGLAYIPVLNLSRDGTSSRNAGVSSLLAWDPVSQRASWRVALPGFWNGGIAATAGNLVFQGRSDGKFMAYSADQGKELWRFDAQVSVVGAPITYRIAGRQYVSVVAGSGGFGSTLDPIWNARNQSRRLLTFTLDGKASLPSAPLPQEIIPVSDPSFKPNPAVQHSGGIAYGGRCAPCHGEGAIAGGSAPDLRASSTILLDSAFRGIVIEGALLQRGMPQFGEMSGIELENIRQYLRSKAMELAAAKPAP